MVILSKGLAFPGGVFYEGSPVAPSSIVPGEWPVAIHGYPFDIEPRECRRAFAAVQRPAQDQEHEPGEASLSHEGLWRRSQSDWSLGAGQLWLDEEESTRRRCRFSLGLDLFNDRALTLLPETQEKRSTGNTNLKLLPAGTQLYVVDGANLVFGGVLDEQDATWPTTSTGGWTVATGLPGGNILDIATSGSHVFVLGSDNSIYRAAINVAAFTLYYNPTAVLTRIYTGLGRLFGSVDNKLYEITATPGETLIFTHPDPNYVFASLGAAPTGIYFAGNIGVSGLGELRHTWVRDDGTAFVAPVVVAEFLNEPINVCEARGNVMLIGTRAGFRMALIQSATTGLDFGPPVTELGECKDIIFDTVGAEVFAWGTFTSTTLGLCGLVRIRPSRQTETLVPAWASDVYAGGAATVLSAASLNGRRYFACSADGFFGATANKVAQGTLLTGRIRYGLLAPKIFATMQWRTDPLEGAVIVTAVTDDGSVVEISSQAAEHSTGVGPLRIADAIGEWLEVTIILQRDATPTLGPTFRWWVMRALPTIEGTEKHIVALKMSRKITTPHGPVRLLSVRSAIDFIVSLIRARSVVKYQKGEESYDVYVVNMEERPDRWAKMDEHFEGLLLVEMDTVN